MTIRKQLQDELKRKQQNADAGDLVAATPDGQVRVRVREVGPIGVAVDEIEVKQPGMDADGARRASERVEREVKYLLEPLRVVESDAEAGVTQTRSETPAVDDAGRHYYELEARPGQLDLKRYQKPDDEPRASEPMDLTHEQLYRLAEDLDRAAREN